MDYSFYFETGSVMRKTGLFLILQIAIASLQAQVWQEPQTVSPKKTIREYFAVAQHFTENNAAAKGNSKVTVSLTVDAQGNSSDFRIVKSSNEKLNPEAIRLARKILWKPAIRNGYPIVAKAEIDIPFKKSERSKQHIQSEIEPTITNIPLDTSNIIYTFAAVETLPKAILPQNYRNLNHYIASNLKYPASALAAGIEGEVQLGLVIEEDGIGSNIHVINSVGGGCDQEAIRILQSIHWVPAIKDHTFVRSRSVFEVTFRIQNHQQQQIPNRQSGGL